MTKQEWMGAAAMGGAFVVGVLIGAAHWQAALFAAIVLAALGVRLVLK